jgi:hypothetical protein
MNQPPERMTLDEVKIREELEREDVWACCKVCSRFPWILNLDEIINRQLLRKFDLKLKGVDWSSEQTSNWFQKFPKTVKMFTFPVFRPKALEQRNIRTGAKSPAESLIFDFTTAKIMNSI